MHESIPATVNQPDLPRASTVHGSVSSTVRVDLSDVHTQLLLSLAAREKTGNLALCL